MARVSAYREGFPFEIVTDLDQDQQVMFNVMAGANYFNLSTALAATIIPW